MKTSEVISTKQKNKFIVTNKDINKNNALLPAVLYARMEDFVKENIAKYEDIVYPIANLYKIEILKNAYLKDDLVLNSQIKKLNDFELHIAVTVSRNNKHQDNIICKAIFKFPLKKHISKAS
ncbi:MULTISPECIES: hypothetical protein [Flavobacteriaceae]|uniref:Thioesterase n=2 Tax=Flavobacteriaceae TaxID=49546 RepID=A0A4Y8AYQ9_9FLAO|nr:MULTISPECIES: hypothetical protein [Flavobacteriaceae]TEW76978.1 hypothetical protein E2488_03770 [Gramella jeungdoensis]